MGDEIAFLAADKHKGFLKVGVITLDVLARHVQCTQNSNFTNLCNISRKTQRMKVDFSPADKHQSFFKVDTIILGLCG